MFCWGKKGKIAAKLKSNWDGFRRWGSAFQKHRTSFPNRPSWPWSCPDYCEWHLANSDWPRFMCLLPSHPFCFLFFLYYSLITFSKKHFYLLFSILLITHLHSRTHIHTHGSATTIHYLLVLNLRRPQPALPVPGVQMALFGTESGIGTSRALLPCGLVLGPSFSQVHSSPPMGGLRQRLQF